MKYDELKKRFDEMLKAEAKAEAERPSYCRNEKAKNCWHCSLSSYGYDCEGNKIKQNKEEKQ